MLSHVNQIFAITVSAKGLLIKCIPLTLTPGQFFLLLTSFDKLPAGTQCGKVKKMSK